MTKVNQQELIEELRVAQAELAALPVSKKNDMESLTGFSANACAHLFGTAAEALQTRLVENAKLREALSPFAHICIMDDQMHGLDPGQMRHHVTKARILLGDSQP